MKTNMRTAVIGVGNMGENHIRIYSQISKLTALADINEKIGKSIAKKFQINHYKDYREMFLKEKIEAVSVVVPTIFHKKVAIDCLNRRIPTLLEKPIADTLTNAQAILDTAKVNHTLLMIGHVERFNPAVIKLKQLISNNMLGEIINLSAIRVGISPPRSINADVVVDLAIHDIDIFNYLLNELPKRTIVTKSKIYNQNIADSASVLMFYSKARATIQTNWITPIKIRRLEVTGTRGFAEVEYITQKLVFYKKNVNLLNMNVFKNQQLLVKKPAIQIYVSKKEPLKEEIKYFLNTIKNARTIKSNGTASYEALKIALY